MNGLNQIKENFSGEIKGQKVALYILQNSRGTTVGICNYGARITHFICESAQKEWIDIVLGFNSLQKYIDAQERYHGVTVGPFANRIAGGSFHLNGKDFQLERNNNGNCLHGGSVGFHDKVWSVIAADNTSIALEVQTAEGEGGFPGGLTVRITFSLKEDDSLEMSYWAQSSHDTPVNLTNHAYFNLNGEGDILKHQVQINAARFAKINDSCIPVGLGEVSQSAFDFTAPKIIEKDIFSDDEQLIIGKGYDHSFELKQENNNELLHAATALGNLSGIQLDVYTTEPAMQFYTGNYLGGLDIGKNGETYADRFGFCFETQHHPDSPNQPSFPSAILKKGEEFTSTTIYKVS